ncbi:MAG: tRNA (pseudouridine(54)-N(1))-methyltransferase TrmY [Polyangiaceae bacterium]|jgi:tRNA (pseudouridine54-N1)-methyltransferase
MRRFIVIGQRATASPDFLLDDVPGTSGRLDVLLRCVRAALLVSHGVRRDTIAYLLLLGGPRAPRALRVDGSVAEYLRPDERSLGTLVKKALATPRAGPAFAVTKHGLAVADGGLDAVLADLGSATHYVLDQGAADVRTCPLDVRNGAFFVGDHLGFGETIRMHLATVGATPIGIGPVSVHAEDAIAVVANEVDRRTQASRLSSAP